MTHEWCWRLLLFLCDSLWGWGHSLVHKDQDWFGTRDCKRYTVGSRDYQDNQRPSRLPTVGHHGWPSAGEKKQVLKNTPSHSVMIKLPLKCIHWPHRNHIIIQSVPLLAHQIRKLEPPNIQPVPSLKQLEAMPSSTIVSHNLKELFRNHILNASENLEDLQSDPLSKTWSPR